MRLDLFSTSSAVLKKIEGIRLKYAQRPRGLVDEDEGIWDQVLVSRLIYALR
jgi:hypothetical protein